MKTPKEITTDILSSLRIPNAPERILIEAYLESVIKQHCKEAITEQARETTTINENIINEIPNNIVEIILTQQELIHVLGTQMVDLIMMSKIELGDDVLVKIKDLEERLIKLTSWNYDNK